MTGLQGKAKRHEKDQFKSLLNKFLMNIRKSELLDMRGRRKNTAQLRETQLRRLNYISVSVFRIGIQFSFKLICNISKLCKVVKNDTSQ